MENFLEYTVFQEGAIKITVLNIIMALFAFIIASISFRMLKAIAKKRFINLPPENYAKTRTLFKIVKYGTYVIIVLVVLNGFGVNLTIFLAGSAALFVGIGIGMQQFFMDFISGITILFDETLSVHDVIQIEEQVGRVEQINFRTTIMVTRDDRVVIIPNHKFLSEYLYNWTKNSKVTRFCLNVGVAYGSDTALVKKILIEATKKHQQVKNNPEPLVLFSDFGDSSLNFELYFFTDNPLRSPQVKSDLRFIIDKAFRENNISIPFPQRDVHFIPKKQEEIPNLKP